MKVVKSCLLLIHLRAPQSLTCFRANATAKQDALLQRISPLMRASSLNVVQIVKDSGLFCGRTGLPNK